MRSPSRRQSCQCGGCFASDRLPVTVWQRLGHRTALLCGKDDVMTYIGLARALLAALATLVLFVAVPLQSGSAAPDGIVLAPHRAIYEMTLATARGGSGVSSVCGRMVLRAHRLGVRGLHAEHALRDAHDQSERQRHRHGSALVELGGRAAASASASTPASSATRRRPRPPSAMRRAPSASDDVKVELTKPAKKDLSLSSRVYFPVQHTDRAAEGRQGRQDDVPRRPLRRLGEGREGLRHGFRHRPRAGRPAATASCRTSRTPSGSTSWRPGRCRSPISSRARTRQDAVPVYELTFLFFENGVSRKLYHRLRRVRHPGRAEGDHVPPAHASARRSRRRGFVIPQVAWRLSGTQEPRARWNPVALGPALG